jgi:peptide-methionine (S)-S-oxide reductase
MIRAFAALAGAALIASACSTPALAESAVETPAAAVTANEKGLKTAVFTGGCFWGI